jgi:hypothetical protein
MNREEFATKMQTLRRLRMTREEVIKKLKGSINLLVEVCHFATDSILCEELEDVIKYLEIDLNNVETLQTVVHGTITMLIHEAGIEKEKGANNEEY